MGLWLEWERAGSRSRRVLDRPLTIGRDASSAIRLEDPTVSRRHAVVSVVAGQAVVDAAGSTNGIVVDGARVEKLSLVPGQSFRIGSTTFRVVLAPVQQQAPAAAAWPPQAPNTAYGLPGPVMPPLHPGPMPPAGFKPSSPARTAGPMIATGLAAVVVIGSVVGVAVLHPFGPVASSSPIPAPSSAPSGPTADGPLPDGWNAIPSAAAGATFVGIDSGSVTFRTADGRVVAFSAATPEPTQAGSAASTKTSKVDGYSFSVPAGWTVARVQDGSHDLFHLSPAGFNPQEGSTKPPITVYWSKTAPQPDAADETIADLGVGNTPVAGTRVFTVGGLSPLMVASMPCSGAYAVMTGDARDEAWINAFMEVLYSWRAS